MRTTMSICIKTMSGDDAFYEYVNNCACKLLSHMQGIDERGKHRNSNVSSVKREQTTRVTQTVWPRSHPYRPYRPCHPFLDHLQAFLPHRRQYSPHWS